MVKITLIDCRPDRNGIINEKRPTKTYRIVEKSGKQIDCLMYADWNKERLVEKIENSIGNSDWNMEGIASSRRVEVGFHS